jgi:hypothetical protein
MKNSIYVTITLSLFCVLLTITTAQGQTSHNIKPKFVAVIFTHDKVKRVGYFVSANDSSVSILEKGHLSLMQMPAKQIHTMLLRRKGAIWKAATIGTVAGVIAAIALIASGSDNEDGGLEKVVAPTLGFYAGGAIGILIGTNRRKIVVETESGYEQVRSKLNRYRARQL